jgi:hypothetical protein
MAPSKDVVRKPLRIPYPKTPFATVNVGMKSTQVAIHQELLASHSPLFPAALKGGIAEAEAKMVDLGEVDVHTFEFFVHLLYNQRLPGSDDDAELYALWNGDVSVALARRRGAV